MYFFGNSKTRISYVTSSGLDVRVESADLSVMNRQSQSGVNSIAQFLRRDEHISELKFCCRAASILQFHPRLH